MTDFSLPDFTFQCRTKTGCGKQALAHLPFDFVAMGGSKPMVIQDAAAGRANLAKTLAKAFSDSGMSLGITPPFPEGENKEGVNFIKSIYEIYKGKGYDCIVALGGQGAADRAKALNIAVTLGPEALSGDTIPGPLTPLVYLPTGVNPGTATAGRASFNGRRFHSPFLAPDQALMDPSLYLDDDRESLLDAALAGLAAACQVYALPWNPPARAYAAAVIRLVMPVLESIKVSGLAPEDNLTQRKKEEKHWQQDLVQAAVLAGYLLSGSPGAPGLHALGRALAANSRLTPGLAMVLLLPGLLEPAPDAAALFQPLAGPTAYSATPPEQRATAAVQVIRNLLNDLHLLSRGRLPRTPAEAGWNQEALASLKQELGKKE
ncbi:MAG: iron-containing alcohol dehydrogenase [Desulfobacter sp.]|nr:MAG: iron-containing alcohol dehydrogenase [Desulfobacter sp.]